VGTSGRLIVSILVAVALATAFWMLFLAPSREQADKLGSEIEQLTSAVEVARSEVAEATTAKRSFPGDYRQLVVLGQAAPAGDETASLLVELEAIASASGVTFQSIQLESSGEVAAAAPPVPATAESEASSESSGSVQAAATVAPTEIAASLQPLGASIGPAGLDVMPYALEFKGDFFQIASFIKKVDSLVAPGNNGVEVDGRLITINGFSLSADTEAGFPDLIANLSVTTYLAPLSQGVTAGATPSAPAPSVTTPAEATAPPAESAAQTSETVSAR
jgi:Tfp pilus assembly protein PilO